MAEYFTAFKERKVRPTFSAHFQEFRQKGAEVEEKRVDGGAATSKCSTHPYSIPPRLSSTIPTAANHCCCSGGRGRATVCGGGDYGEVGVAAVTAACLFSRGWIFGNGKEGGGYLLLAQRKATTEKKTLHTQSAAYFPRIARQQERQKKYKGH